MSKEVISRLTANLALAQEELSQAVWAHKKKKGVLKNGDFLAIMFPDSTVPVIWYHFANLTMCLTAAYEPVSSALVYDIVEECERHNYDSLRVKYKRLSKQEAMEYL